MCSRQWRDEEKWDINSALDKLLVLICWFLLSKDTIFLLLHHWFGSKANQVKERILKWKNVVVSMGDLKVYLFSFLLIFFREV